MLNGYATKRSEAKYPRLWDGLRFGASPSVTTATGTKLYDIVTGKTGSFSGDYTAASWSQQNGRSVISHTGSTASGITFHAGGNYTIDLRTASNPCWSMFVWTNPNTSTAYPTFLCFGVWSASLGKAPSSMRLDHWRNNQTSHQSTGLMTANVWNAVGLSNNNLSGTFYINGLSSGGFSGAAAIATSGLSGGWGYGSTSPTSSINGMIQGSQADAYLWDRLLSDSEYRLLSSEQNVVFARKRIVRVGALLSGFRPYFASRRSATIGGGV